MSLQQLSPELWIHILSFVGSENFRQDVRRLTACRTWYRYAWPVLFQDLQFTAESLATFIAQTTDRNLITRVQHHIQSVRVSLRGCPHDMGDDGIALRETWTDELHVNMDKLSVMLRASKQLHTLDFEACRELSSTWLRPYLMSTSLGSLLSLKTLKVLNLDLGGSGVIPVLVGGRDAIHLCQHISMLLPTLQKLRCRMTSICPAIFELPSNAVWPINLEEIIINLGLREPSLYTISFQDALRRCRSGGRHDYRELAQDMEDAARQLVPSLEQPEIFRILSKPGSSDKLQSYDVLTGRRMQLADDADWEDDGPELESRIADVEQL